VSSSCPFLSILNRGITATAFTADERKEGLEGICDKVMGPAPLPAVMVQINGSNYVDEIMIIRMMRDP
jgi:hypothetical protein